jgi:hypothetical protein
MEHARREQTSPSEAGASTSGGAVLQLKHHVMFAQQPWLRPPTDVIRPAVPQWKTCAQRWMTGAKSQPLDRLNEPYSQAFNWLQGLGSCGIRN